jgi:uncharacterized protein (TIGR03435 family)
MNLLPRTVISLLAFVCNLVSAPPVQFEVADVHVSPLSLDYHRRTMGGSMLHRDQFEVHRATMVNLIAIAWGIDEAKVTGGPNWLEMERFDVRAKTPPDTNQETMRPMLQALLADRFGLAVHNDSRQLSGWTLTAAKNIRLTRPDTSESAGCKFDQSAQPGSGDAPVPMMTLTCHNATMGLLAQYAGELPGGYIDEGSIVADRTGLTGEWSFTLRFAPRGSGVAAGAHAQTLFDALEQLGLKLEPGTVATDVMVVDRVNRTPTPNSPGLARAFPPAPAEFEVAVIKPSAPGDRTLDGYMAGGNTRVRYQAGGRVLIQGSLLGVIRWAWGINTVRIAGLPAFADADAWDIEAKPPGDVRDGDILSEMLKSLLANRFKLAYHFEDRPLMTNTLVAVKPKMKKADPAERTVCREGPEAPTRNDPRDTNPFLSRLLTCRNTSMSQLAYLLFRGMASGYVGSPVFDATGLEGGWDFTLSFSLPAQVPKDATADPNGAISLPDAMEKQIGIRMAMQKHPVEVLVIDHVERKPTDN